MVPPELGAIARLLPAPLDDARQLGGPGRPWSLRYASRTAVLRRNDLAGARSLGMSEADALASTAWLHGVLRDLGASGFIAPVPLPDLDGASIAVVDGATWELLSHVPGRPMGWSDGEMAMAGALLARFHEVSLELPARPQRPGALPLTACRPVHPAAVSVRAEVESELASLATEARAVIHGDATQANVVVDETGAMHLVDFAIAFEELLVGDVGSALWRNGRTDVDAVRYDPRRCATFVSGYRSVRPLPPSAGQAIATCMLARGLQLQQRLELRGGTDATVVQRLLAIRDARRAIAAAIDDRA